MDSKIQIWKIVLVEDPDIWIYSWRNPNQGRLWIHMALVAINLENKKTLAIIISRDWNMFVTQRLLLDMVKGYGNHQNSTDGATRYPQGLRISQSGTSLSSSFGEKCYWKYLQYIEEELRFLIVSPKYRYSFSNQ